MAGALLAEWGADVIKIENPGTGDPYRGLVTAGLHKEHNGVDVQFQAANRAKRSVGIDLKRPAGRDHLGIAAAVGSALYRRGATGEPSVVDASLLATGMWQAQMDLVNASIDGATRTAPRPDRHEAWNPLMLAYRTADDRFLMLQMLAPDRNWPGLCAALGRPEMAADPRFADMDARRRNSRACVELLDEIFVQRDLDAWRRLLADFTGEWTPSLLPHEVAGDPQVRANGYLAEVDLGHGRSLPMVAAPARFDGEPARPARAPEHGEHTEAVLLEYGLSWAELGALKDDGTIL